MLRGNKAAISQFHTRISLLSSVPVIAASNVATKSGDRHAPSGECGDDRQVRRPLMVQRRWPLEHDPDIKSYPTSSKSSLSSSWAGFELS
jgi:hypothetical protein